MNAFKTHPILRHPHQYDICEFHYHIDRENPGDSFIDMTLQKDTETVVLRFWQPVDLKIDEGFPQKTGGMVFYDLSGDGLENIRIKVADEEASHGAVTFFARDVEMVSASKGA